MNESYQSTQSIWNKTAEIAGTNQEGKGKLRKSILTANPVRTTTSFFEKQVEFRQDERAPQAKRAIQSSRPATKVMRAKGTLQGPRERAQL